MLQRGRRRPWRLTTIKSIPSNTQSIRLDTIGRSLPVDLPVLSAVWGHERKESPPTGRRPLFHAVLAEGGTG